MSVATELIKRSVQWRTERCEVGSVHYPYSETVANELARVADLHEIVAGRLVFTGIHESGYPWRVVLDPELY